MPALERIIFLTPKVLLGNERKMKEALLIGISQSSPIVALTGFPKGEYETPKGQYKLTGELRSRACKVSYPKINKTKPNLQIIESKR